MIPVPAEERIKDDSPRDFDEFVERFKDNYSADNIEFLRKVYLFSENAHRGQIRRSGEPYISHPLGVSAILAELRLDVSTLATGLLHDTVEDTNVTLEDVEKNFGTTIAALVDGVTKISKIKFRHTHEKQGENIRKMIVAMGRDVRVVLVKIADRLHNMRTLNSMPFEKQAQIAQETLDIYAPLAGRLGIMSLKVELEDLGFRYTLPDKYYELAQSVALKKKEREKYIEDVKRLLTTELEKRCRFPFEVSGRPKHLYSIHKKMHMRNVDYDQVYDVLAFRACVNTIPECYEVLGVVHSLWKPIPGRFKDFIAMAKANNYQSLHTTVIGPSAQRIEIQIRTFEMHRIAEWGIAAHWRYKEQSRGSMSTSESAIEKFNWLRELVTLHQQTRDSDEFLENVKTDLADSEIYVFTPKGEVMEFPEGATPIDFAFSIHTDLGRRIVAARVNGKMVTLRHRLKNGDTIEIITSKNQSPSKDWLKFCITSRAKSKIRTYVKEEQRARALTIGKELLEKGFRKDGAAVARYLKGPKFDKYLKDHGCATEEDLYILVGYGKVMPQDVAKELIPQTEVPKEAEKPSFLQQAVQAAAKKTKKSASLISVDGMDDVLVRYAKCCAPIPGDSILGFITRGRGIVIHRSDCEKSFEMDQTRQIDVEWNRSSAGNIIERMVSVRVVSHDLPGLLKQMTEAFSTHGLNIHNAQIRTTKDKKAVCIFDVSVRDTSHLSQVMATLNKIHGIIGVTRLTHSS